MAYSTINDNDVKVSDADLKAKYDEQKEMYKQYVESRDIKYVEFQVLPSAADRKAMMAVKIDVTIMSPETSHCAVVALTEKAAIMSCNATLMMFSLNAATKAAIYITTRIAAVADGAT